MPASLRNSKTFLALPASQRVVLAAAVAAREVRCGGHLPRVKRGMAEPPHVATALTSAELPAILDTFSERYNTAAKRVALSTALDAVARRGALDRGAVQRWPLPVVARSADPAVQAVLTDSDEAVASVLAVAAASSHGALRRAAEAHNEFCERSVELRARQRAWFACSQQRDSAGVHWLRDSCQRLQTEAADTLAALRALNSAALLTPHEVHALDWLVQRTDVAGEQLRLYERELAVALGDTPTTDGELASLVIVRQPFPACVSKPRQLQAEALAVQLLTGAACVVEVLGAVVSDVLAPGGVSEGTRQLLLTDVFEETAHALDMESGVAVVPVRIVSGTRKSAVRLRFSLAVRVGHAFVAAGAPVVSGDRSQASIKVALNAAAAVTRRRTAVLVSAPTAPFVSITNDCQWETSIFGMLRDELYGERPLQSCPWPRIANALQRVILGATRQPLGSPVRALSKRCGDFATLQQLYAGG